MKTLRNGSVVNLPIPEVKPSPPPAIETDKTVAWRGQSQPVSAAPPVLATAPVTASGPAHMLQALGDGQATIEVPLRAGSYEVNGVGFTVLPGTVAHVNVQVKNGELVPVSKGEKGSSVEIEPAVDLPLWITGKGAALKGEEARREFEVQLGGFFDLSFKAKKLSEMVSSGDARPANPKQRSDEMGELANKLLDLSQVKVDAQVNLTSSTLDVGGATVAVDRSTKFAVKGNGQRATVSGHVKLDGFRVDQSGLQLTSRTGGQAELLTSIERERDGGYAVDSRLSGVKLSVNKFIGSQPSSVASGKVDKLTLGPTEIEDGEFRLQTKLGMNGLNATGLSKPVISMSLKGQGSINEAQVTIKDSKDAAGLALAGHFDGKVAFGPDGVRVDAKVTDALVSVSDLQESVKGAQVSIAQAQARGDVDISVSPGHLTLDGQAKFDILVDDFKTATTDLGRTWLNGSGRFHVGDGVLVESGKKPIRGSTVIERASIDQGKGRVAVLTQSTLSGEMTRFRVGQGGPDIRLKNIAVDLNVKRATFDVGNTVIGGGGQLKGKGDVVLDASGFSVTGPTQVAIKLADGTVRSSTVKLNFAKSSAQLNMNDLALGKVTHVDVVEGTRLDMVLASGSVQLGDNTIVLEKGARAQLAVKKVEIKDGKADLRGSLSVEAAMHTDRFMIGQSGAQGVKVDPISVKGKATVYVDDVQLKDDQLSLRNAHISLGAEVGNYVGAGAYAAGKLGVGTLVEPVRVASIDEVKQSTAAQLAGIPPGVQAAVSPVSALALLKEGTVYVNVPLRGSILGISLPERSRVTLALTVREGQIVHKETQIGVAGGGRSLSMRVPKLDSLSSMQQLAALLEGDSEAGSDKSSSVPGIIDFTHAQIDVTNAIASAGTIAVQGGTFDIGEGSKLSLHGTPLAAKLTGSLNLNGVNVIRDDFVVKGNGGRADLELDYALEGDKAIVRGGLTNVTMATEYLVRKSDDGDYLSLGPGHMWGAMLSLSTKLNVSKDGLPNVRGTVPNGEAVISVPNFVGELKGARMTSSPNKVELGPSRVAAAMNYSTQKGLSLRGTFDTVDVAASGLRFPHQGRMMMVEQGRFMGYAGTVDLTPSKLSVDGHLAWDAVVRELPMPIVDQQLTVGQFRVTGAGHFKYSKVGETRSLLKVEGGLALTGNTDGTQNLKELMVDGQSGVTVRR